MAFLDENGLSERVGELAKLRDSGRTYTETEQEIVDLAELTEADYLEALEKLGVSADD